MKATWTCPPPDFYLRWTFGYFRICLKHLHLKTRRTRGLMDGKGRWNYWMVQVSNLAKVIDCARKDNSIMVLCYFRKSLQCCQHCWGLFQHPKREKPRWVSHLRWSWSKKLVSFIYIWKLSLYTEKNSEICTFTDIILAVIHNKFHFESFTDAKQNVCEIR